MAQYATGWIQVLPWWYQAVPRELLNQQRLIGATVVDYFSFGILLRTLFQPWKRDQIATERLPLQERLNVWALNLMSRLIGAVVRSAAILAGCFVLLLLAVFFAALWVVWFTAPILALSLVGLGLVTILGGGR